MLDIEKTAVLKERKKKKWNLSLTSNSRLNVSIKIVAISAALDD